MSPATKLTTSCRALFLCALALVFASHPARAQDSRTVTGFVITPFGKPAIGANVEAIYCTTGLEEVVTEIRHSFTTQTDEHGQFTFYQLPLKKQSRPSSGSRGEYTLVVRYDDYVKNARLVLETGDSLLPLRLILNEGDYIEGVVVDEHGHAVPKAWVWPVENYRTADEPYDPTKILGNAAKALAVQTDEIGRFRIGPLCHFPWSIKSDSLKAGYAHIWSIYPGMNDISVTLQHCGVVSGRVVKAIDGAPLENILVQQTGFDGMNAQYIRTDSDGRYTVRAPLGDSLRLIASSPNQDFVQIYESAAINYTSGSDVTNHTIQLIPAGAVSGRLIDQSTSKGIAGSYVIAASINGRRWWPVTTITDANGYFQLKGLADGEIGIFARAPLGYRSVSGDHSELWAKAKLDYSYMQPVGASITVTLEVGEIIDSIDLAMDSRSIVRGRVVDQAGAPIVDGIIYGWPALNRNNTRLQHNQVSVQTDSEGRFELYGLLEDAHIIVRAPGYLGTHFGPFNGTENTELDPFELVTGGSIHGSLLVDGSPIGGVRIECKRTDYQPPFEIVTATNANGAFEFAGVPVGSYEIRGYMGGDIKRLVELTEASPVANLSLSGEDRRGIIRGVVSLDDEPMAFQRIDLEYDEYKNLEVTTNGQGEFLIPRWIHMTKLTVSIPYGPSGNAKKMLRQQIAVEPGKETLAHYRFSSGEQEE